LIVFSSIILSLFQQSLYDHLVLVEVVGVDVQVVVVLESLAQVGARLRSAMKTKIALPRASVWFPSTRPPASQGASAIQRCPPLTTADVVSTFVHPTSDTISMCECNTEMSTVDKGRCGERMFLFHFGKHSSVHVCICFVQRADVLILLFIQFGMCTLIGLDVLTPPMTQYLCAL
jgi:hypothetical protein